MSYNSVLACTCTMLYFSKQAGQALMHKNPDIADLSDDNRPTKIAERFSQLYDDQWTDAYDALMKDGQTERDVIRILLNIVHVRINGYSLYQ